MPELTLIHFALLAAAIAIGLIIGWMIRGDRCAREKIAVNASWQDQFESQQSEHNRLAEQNKSLMEQISQYQASHRDHMNRAKELSDSLREAYQHRDDLQRNFKDARAKLELAVMQRNKFRDELETRPKDQALREKDDKIFDLSRELTSWQNRVPPLVERFQNRDREAKALEEELHAVRAQLSALEDRVRSDHTRIEPMDADTLPDGGDASNEPSAATAAHPVESYDDDEDHVSGIHTYDSFIDTGASVSSEVVEVDDFEVAAASEDSTTADDDFEDVFANDRPSSSNPDADDLKMIKGIGPSIERTLHDLGVRQFHQIAEMSEYDIDRVARELKGFRSRIYRENWIGQARDLHYQKINGRS